MAIALGGVLLLTVGSGAQAPGHECVVVIDHGSVARWAGSAEECATRLSPSSTYKIPHALIGLETKVVSATTIETWDGTKYPEQPKWNLDHTVLSAIRPSVLWFYQRMAPKIGASRAKEWLDKFGYGNRDTSGPITAYWINGTLRISPDEQLAFLKKFYDATLPVSKVHLDQVKGATFQAPGTVENARGVQQLEVQWRPGMRLSSKTGATTAAAGEGVSWLVGELTIDQRRLVFASAVWRERGSVDGFDATRLAFKTLVDRGVIAPRAR
ncbi:MAG: penicillin-binding transpeptidase domain-containing protein [Acidimicrobiia bacterium]